MLVGIVPVGIAPVGIGTCTRDEIVDMTLNDLYVKVKAVHFGTNRFLIRLPICCQVSSINSNFCLRSTV